MGHSQIRSRHAFEFEDESPVGEFPAADGLANVAHEIFAGQTLR
jgi:hypothetical protein